MLLTTDVIPRFTSRVHNCSHAAVNKLLFLRDIAALSVQCQNTYLNNFLGCFGLNSLATLANE